MVSSSTHVVKVRCDIFVGPIHGPKSSVFASSHGAVLLRRKALHNTVTLYVGNDSLRRQFWLRNKVQADACFDEFCEELRGTDGD